MKQIYCQINKCLACRSCELACAEIHSESKDLLTAIKEDPLPRSRIHVELIDEEGDLNHFRSIAIQCRNCEEPLCVQACISGGLYKDPATGNVLINDEKCVGCWSCIMVCPFGVVVRYEEIHRAVKCDHCFGREVPVCLKACPTGALLYSNPNEIEINF
jgi:anaerobic carbon-monoxide dehydrogenase iron sulfur subunit